ncbi:MAG: hypothetical protein GY856_11740 [bacterium]|nr:hypothetical protein [bacterium]
MKPSPETPSLESLSPELLSELLGELLEEGLPVELRVTGSSMSPFVRSGDVIVLSPRPAAAIRLGDVVAFLRGEKRLVVHRVVSRRGEGFLTRGDASPRADGRVADGEILGAVDRVTRKGVRVRLGLGAERVAIAWLSHRGLLAAMLRPLRRLVSSTHQPCRIIFREGRESQTRLSGDQ